MCPPTELDAFQVIKEIYDESTNRIRTDASVTATFGELEVSLLSNEDNVAIGNVDNTRFVEVTSDSELQTSDAGAKVSLESIDDKLTAVNLGLDVIDAELQLKANESTLSTLNAKFVSGTDIGDVTINNGSGASAVNIQDGGNSITIDGTVGISGSVAVTGPLTDAELRATPVPISVSGDFTVVQPTGSNLHTVLDSGTLSTITNVVHVDDNGGSLTVDNNGTFAVQAAQSGTWNINNISGTISLPTGAATAALQTQPGVDIGDVTVNNAAGASAVNIQDGGNSITIDGNTGNYNTTTTTNLVALGTVNFSCANGISTVVVEISGTWTGIVGFYGTVDGSTYTPLSATDLILLDGQIPVSTSANGRFAFNTVGLNGIRLMGEAGMTGTADLTLNGSSEASIISAIQAVSFVQISGSVPLPSDAATETTLSAINTKTPTLGQAVMASSTPVVLASNQSSIPVTGSGNFTVTQGTGTNLHTVVDSGSITINAALPSGTNNIGDIDVLTLPELPAGDNNIGNVDAIQSGTWTVEPGNSQNTTSWKVAPTDSDNTIIGSKLSYIYEIPSQVHVAAANTIHWDIFNADATLVVRVLGIYQIPNITTAVAGINFDWQIFRTSSVGTGGSAQTAWLPDTTQTALDADITCRSKPSGGAATSGAAIKNYTISSEETNAATQMFHMMSIGGITNLVPNYLYEYRRGIVLRQNQGLKCVQVTNSNAGNTAWQIIFTVE